MTDPGPSASPDEHVGARSILDADEISRSLVRMAHQVAEQNRGATGLVLLGIPSRGVPLAARLARLIGDIEGVDVPLGTLDITMYRDDLRANPTRTVGRTHIPGSIEGKNVVLVDDVLYSGRTVLAALDALKDVGRPASVRLAVLVDRGHRELPVHGDVVGLQLGTARDERVRVQLVENDGVDAVTIQRMEATR